jgi:CheY-like chemotaxis protein
MANRILLADDSITIQKVVNLTFADEGIEVVAVSNGDMAERRLADVQPDLVLADIFMPGKNGYELCEAIKESAQYHHIPVVLLVGAFEPFDQAEARRVKADAHLTKPFESRTLVDTVRKLISASGQPRTGPLPALPVPDAKTAPVEPLPAAPPMPAPAPPPAEPRVAAQMTQPFNLDLPTMASQSAPPAPPPLMTATMPLDYNYGSGEDPLDVPVEVQVAEAPAAAETAFAASGSLHRKTDDLSFADSQPPFEALGLDDLFAEPPANEAAPHFATSEPAPAAHGEASHETGFGVPSTFGYAAEEMLLDFDQPAPAVTRAAHEPFAFDIEEREPASVDAAGIQPESASVELGVEDKVLTTTLLETPAPTMPVDSAINTNPLEMPATQTAGEAGETALAAEAAIDESALFNVDDPLGDVLDESLLEAAAPKAPAASTAPLENVAESLAVDAPSQPASVAPVEAPRVEGIASDAPMQVEASAASQESPVDYEVEFPVSPTAEAAAPEPVADAPAIAMNVAPVEEAAASETGFGFTPIGEEAEAAGTLPRATEAKFTSSSMWTNEEARFAAIDIEATLVEEPAEAVASEAPAQPAESFVFDEDASPYTTQANKPVEVAAPVEAVEPMAEMVAEEPAAIAPPSQEAPAPAAASDVELSPTLIDEIVRRVVAQISESVVREIAWEVVPDCVERVIKEMTAHEVSKH